MRGWLPVKHKQEIGRRFREVREQKALTQAQVFDKAGFKGKGVVSNIERGKGYSLDTLARACTAMGVTVKDVVNGHLDHIETVAGLERTMPKRTGNVKIKTGKEWSIDVGGYRLTIDKEPEYILLEKI